MIRQLDEKRKSGISIDWTFAPFIKGHIDLIQPKT